MPNKIRIDKWLWAIRLYKTRNQATEACKAGKVKVLDKNVKASYMLETGMTVQVRKRDRIFVVKVLSLIEKRTSATIAQTCYEDLSPPAEPSEKLPSFFFKTNEQREKGLGRPTKRERRTLDRFKENE
jgi:ribosome-associated heat shock protein Hsp15